MRSTSATLGVNVSSFNNLAVVTDAGSVWSNAGTLFVGYLGAGNQLIVSNNAVVSIGEAVYVGYDPTSLTNQVTVSSSMLLVTNATTSGLLEIRRGTTVLNGGLIESDVLRMTNGVSSRIEVNRSTLTVRNSRINAGNPVVIGDGINPAALVLAGNGTHDFTGTLGLIISSNATLMGNGSLLVQLQVQPGATLSPGDSIGKIAVDVSPSLAGTMLMEISKNGGAWTNDQFQVAGTLNYGGSLIVTNLSPTALVAGDRFPLFTAGSYAGGFISITLPPLPAPLSWTNRLLVDGSIEIIAPPAIAMSGGSYTNSFDSLSASGSSNPWQDNGTLLGWYAAQSLAPFVITNYRASDGSLNSGGLYSFGAVGSNERALGAIPINASGDISYGLGFINDTPITLSNVVVSFTAEQWRSSDAPFPNTLTFWYRVSPTPVTNPEPGITTNWMEVTNLNFTSPVVLGMGVPINGNQPSNRQIYSDVLIEGLAVPPGQFVFLRWHDINDSGSDHGLAVDDLTVEFSPLVPQLTSILLDSANSIVHLAGHGEANVTYGIEAATNLAPPIFWERIGTNTANNLGAFQFSDTNAPGFPTRYYRALFP